MSASPGAALPSNPILRLTAAAFLTLAGFTANAQQPAPDKPAAAPTPPPSWQQGRTPEQEKSPLHPFAIHVTGKPAKELPVDKLRVPAGFKVEVWVDGVPAARSLRSATRARYS